MGKHSLLRRPGGSGPGEPLAERGSWARRVGPGRRRAGWGGAPYIQSADPGSAPKGREEKKTLVGFGLKNKIQNKEKNRSVGITATPARRAL